MNARTVPLCRRALLQYAIGVAGGVAISCAQPTPAAAGPKISAALARAPAGSARGGLGKRPLAFPPHDVSCGAVC